MLRVMGGMRRTATVLFTDVVGSTDVLTALGEERAEVARQRHFASMRGALAVHRGAEVKTLGDGFMAVFDSAADGVACAVTMQRVVARDAELRPDEALQLRVGISAGEVTCAEEDYFGTPVVEASRLCASAAAGRVLCGHVVHLLAGSAGAHRFRGVGDMSLKGLSDPVPVFEVDWDPDDECALRVALADDSALLRQGVASVLESEGIQVVLQASDADSLMESLPGVNPHVAVLDVRMPPTHTTEGLDAACRIQRDHPGIGVLVLSQSIEPGAARRLLATASDGVGYLLKERVADIGELVSAIRTVAGGGSAIDPAEIAAL